MLVGAKGLLLSKTVIGGILAMLPEVIEIVNQVAASGVLPEKVASILHLVGGGLAVFGRVVAKDRISGLLK